MKRIPYICPLLERAKLSPQANFLPPQTKQAATSRWSSFSRISKAAVSRQLLDTQYGLCAYSELSSDSVEGFGTHIEHVKPKSEYPQLTFDYDNLVSSALHSEDLKELLKENTFSGHAKGGNYDPELFVSCLDSGCENFFVYISNGRVEPNEKLDDEGLRKAEYTIGLLNLNAQILIVKRKNWLDEIDALIDNHLQNNDSLADLAEIELLPVNNKLRSFFSATRQRYLSLGEQVLIDNAPDLV